LLEAAQSRELLLCELTSIALDVSLATSAVAAGCSADAGVAVLASSGANPSGGLPVAGLLEAARGQIVRTNAVAIYSVEQASSAGSAGIATVLFVNVPVSSGSRADSALKLVVQLARQGLELVALRSPVRRDVSIHDDPLGRTRSAAVDPDADILLFESAGMRQLADRLQRIRTSSSTVLITGESGVGKELVARAIHATIPRPRAPFVPFNCSAAPRDLIESQIFGHRKGAFTGATADNPGLARSAKGGTLFLDEIGDLPLELQPKFLRFLESGEILPLGATAPMHVDARVVAATNADLEELVATRKFREDLYHRLNIIRLHVPPLRDRREDIPLLAGHFLSRLSTRAGRATPSRLSKEALAALVAYPWPGNVRQLRNEIERSVTFGAEGVEITLEHLSDEIRMAVDRDKANPWTRGDGHTSTDVLTERLRQYEIDEIRRALAASGMNLTRAATRLGMARQNLQRRMRKLGLTAGEF
ncbi:MAG TPA: sigma-54 dependent transcriptional regulator, partial [Blastocatellia bacterium]|nr:sigma-54 dependent transcriptional regulator [Blastocatellia bacterium]